MMLILIQDAGAKPLGLVFFFYIITTKSYLKKKNNNKKTKFPSIKNDIIYYTIHNLFVESFDLKIFL